MTTFHLRSDPQQPAPDDQDAFLLDWFTGAERQRSTINATQSLLRGLRPTPETRDLLRLAAAVFCADKVALRKPTRDAWTRELELELPVANRARWQRARPALTEALAFLSGDRWTLRFRTSGEQPPEGETKAPRPGAVCLFSGGLDSLTGAIDLLEQGDSLVLVGHFDSGYIGGVQDTLVTKLRQLYREQTIDLRQLQLSPAKPNELQARPLPPARQRERTTRARSFLFIAAGLAVASAFEDTVPLQMPENGFIGINVPLVPSRAGSLSTRTTHPYFLEQLNRALVELGIENPIVNPFRVQTKGELLAACRNPQALAALVEDSVSCAHPESARYEKLPLGNCGWCFPCLIRRAALHSIGLDSAASYRRDALTDTALLGDSSRGASLRALRRGLAREPRPDDILRNGIVPAADAPAFADVYRRGRAELSSWLGSNARRSPRRAARPRA